MFGRAGTLLKRRTAREEVPPFVDEYRREGFCVIPGVFDEGEINQIRGAAISALAGANDLPKHGYGASGLEFKRVPGAWAGTEAQFPAISFWPALVSPLLEAVRRDKRLTDIVTAILGPDTRQLNNQFYFHLPGDGDSFEWHQDIMFRHPLEDYPGIVEDDTYLQTAIIVDEFSDEVAPLYMVPKSFELGNLGLLSTDSGEPDLGRLRARPDLDWPKCELGLEPVVLRARPGDVALWCSLTVHGSLPGPRDGTRMYYMNGFAATRNSREWPHYSVDGETVPLDTTQFPAPLRVAGTPG